MSAIQEYQCVMLHTIIKIAFLISNKRRQVFIGFHQRRCFFWPYNAMSQDRFLASITSCRTLSQPAIRRLRSLSPVHYRVSIRCDRTISSLSCHSSIIRSSLTTTQSTLSPLSFRRQPLSGCARPSSNYSYPPSAGPGTTGMRALTSS